MDMQFVIQEHTRLDQTHWDLMLQSGNTLKTWRIDTGAQNIVARPIAAIKILDHDLKFLNYQGPVNKGSGSVRIIDKGTFEIIEEIETKIEFRLSGKMFSGEFVLENIEKDQWRFFKTAQ